MPQFDKTGPAGKGPETGRGMGACGNGRGTGMGMGRGCGCGMGFGRRRFNAMTGTEKEELLKTEIEELKEELQLAEKELGGLEK